MPITHAKVATLPDDASSEVKASDWNDDHVGAGSDDQTAAEVPFTPAGGIAATDVQAAIEEVAAEAGGTGFDYIQEADPGAVGAGKFWLFAGSLGYPDTYQLRRRNAANTAWLPVTSIYTETAEGVYINTPDNGSYLQLGLSGERTELSSADGTILFLDGGYFKLNSAASQGVTSGNVDPSAGAGVVGVRGSIYLRNDGVSAGSVWAKTGDADTAWTLLGPGEVAIQDEGTPVVSTGTVDFAGAGVSVAQVGAKAVVTIPGGAGLAPAEPQTQVVNDDGGGIGWANPASLGDTVYAFRVEGNDHDMLQLRASGEIHGGSGSAEPANIVDLAVDGALLLIAGTTGHAGFRNGAGQVQGRTFLEPGNTGPGALTAPIRMVGGTWIDPSTFTFAYTVGESVFDLRDGTWWVCTVAGTPGTWVQSSLPGSPQTYTESNVTTDRAFNANSTTVDEIADVLGTLIADLRSRGVVA